MLFKLALLALVVTPLLLHKCRAGSPPSWGPNGVLWTASGGWVCDSIPCFGLSGWLGFGGTSDDVERIAIAAAG